MTDFDPRQNHATAQVTAVGLDIEYVHAHMGVNIYSAMFSALVELDEDGVRRPIDSADLLGIVEAISTYCVSGVSDAYVNTDAATADVSAETISDSVTAEDSNAAADTSALFADAASVSESAIAETEVAKTESITVTETYTEATQAALRDDVFTPADSSSAAITMTIADGTAYTYFAGDYAASDYGTTDNFIDDRYITEFAAVSSDSFATTDAQNAALYPMSADTLTTAEAYAATSTSAPSDTITVSDSAGASWVFPDWADAAVPVDDIAIALTVASTDTSTTDDSTSAVIQNYALDPDYFSGDYATTAY